jgi:hypothetical protein
MPSAHPQATPAYGGDTRAETTPRRGPFATLWSAVTATVGAAMGLVPHVLHHIGLFAGAALVTGIGGNLLFGALGLLLSVPLLRRLYRRFGTWKAPAVAVAVFAITFSLSAFVIGPAISGTDSPPAPGPTEQIDPDHAEHHN